jgi:hypothetical protein
MSRSARLLSGFRAQPAQRRSQREERADHVLWLASEAHFEDAFGADFSLYAVIVRIGGQLIKKGSGACNRRWLRCE